MKRASVTSVTSVTRGKPEIEGRGAGWKTSKETFNRACPAMVQAGSGRLYAPAENKNTRAKLNAKAPQDIAENARHFSTRL